MFVAFVLRDQVKAAKARLIVKAYKRFHSQNEVSEIECMLNLGTIFLFNHCQFHELLNVLLNAIKHEVHRVKSDKLVVKVVEDVRFIVNATAVLMGLYSQ